LKADPDAFDLILMDLNMPEMNGLELARRARAIPFKGRTIVMSGRVTEEDAYLLSDYGITQVLHKPFDSEGLRSALRTAFNTG